MVHLIDKDALVAEIERRKESCAKQREDMLNVQCHTLADDASVRMGELNCIKDFLDTLEVKKVDLEKGMEVNKELSYEDYHRFFEEHPNFPNDWGFDEAWIFANYFFELGLKAQKGE